VCGEKKAAACWAGQATYRAGCEKRPTVLGEKSTAPCSARRTLHRAGRDRRPIVLGVESPLRCGAGKAPHRAGGEKHCNGEFSTRQAPWTCRFTPSTLECLSHRAPWSAWSHRAPWSAVHTKHLGVAVHICAMWGRGRVDVP